MSTSKVTIDGMADAVENILTGYADELKAGVKQDAQAVAKQCVSQLKSTSPVGSGSKKGHYNAGWTSTIETETNDSINVVVHNSKKPGLAHLLENGHTLVYFGKRTGKYVAARPHIAPVETYAIEEFQRRVEERASQ